MDWILPIVFGWAGGAWAASWHSNDDDGWWRNPPGCIMCGGIIGAVVAVIIEMLVRPQMGDALMLDHAVLNLASGVFGSTLIGTGIGMMKGRSANG